MGDMLRQKLDLVHGQMEREGIDLWLTLSTETSLGGDPVVRDLLGTDVVSETAILVGDEELVLTAEFDSQGPQQCGWQVQPYSSALGPALAQTMARLRPKTIGLNISERFIVAAGLRHSEFQRLCAMIPDYVRSFRNAEGMVVALRGTLVEEEARRVREAVRHTQTIYEAVATKMLQPGVSERQVAANMREMAKERGLGLAWGEAHCPIVSFGANAGGSAHAVPTDTTLRKGDLVVIDFGVRYDGYSSDVMRTFYVDDGKPVDAAIQRGFSTAMAAMEVCRTTLGAGVVGNAVDKAAKSVIAKAGYEPVPFCTGHPLGRFDHEIGALLGPDTPRYKGAAMLPVLPQAAYALEPMVWVPGRFRVGVEENVWVTDDGIVDFTQPQTELWMV